MSGDKSSGVMMVCRSYLYVLLLKLLTVTGKHGERLKSYRTAYVHCYNYIKENFCNIVSLEEIANKCCVSKVYLCRLFKQYAGISPMAYVNKLKMNKAAFLLIQSNSSIKQISLMLHYNNPYYFSEMFKKEYGISPKYFRENNS